MFSDIDFHPKAPSVCVPQPDPWKFRIGWLFCGVTAVPCCRGPETSGSRQRGGFLRVSCDDWWLAGYVQARDPKFDDSSPVSVSFTPYSH